MIADSVRLLGTQSSMRRLWLRLRTMHVHAALAWRVLHDVQCFGGATGGTVRDAVESRRFAELLEYSVPLSIDSGSRDPIWEHSITTLIIVAAALARRRLRAPKLPSWAPTF